MRFVTDTITIFIFIFCSGNFKLRFCNKSSSSSSFIIVNFSLLWGVADFHSFNVAIPALHFFWSCASLSSSPIFRLSFFTMSFPCHLRSPPFSFTSNFQVPNTLHWLVFINNNKIITLVFSLCILFIQLYIEYKQRIYSNGTCNCHQPGEDHRCGQNVC